MNKSHVHKFYWGSATSAHQVEGNNIHNDWWGWEQAGGRVQSGIACDHYNLFREDFTLASSLGHTAHRLSIEWSRVEPIKGVWDAKEIAHYRAVLEDIRAKNMVPFVTLHHFTSPTWFMDGGGWESSDAAEYFSRFVRKMAEEFGDIVEYWMTFNEPNVYAAHGWWFARWTPQKRNPIAFLKVVKNISASHKEAYRVLRDVCNNPQVGIAQSIIGYYPFRAYSPLDQIFSFLAGWCWNYLFLDLTNKYNDFIGVQYYFSRGKKFQLFPLSVGSEDRPGFSVSDMGWPIDPHAFEKELGKLHRRYNLPMYVTENGVADAGDTIRGKFIRDHVQAVKNARKEGADIRGYFYWSLLDNFEWAEGFVPRFGLVEVDQATKKRTPRSSAYVFKEIIEEGIEN